MEDGNQMREAGARLSHIKGRGQDDFAPELTPSLRLPGEGRDP